MDSGQQGFQFNLVAAFEQGLITHNRELTDAQKEELLFKCRDAESREAVDEIIEAYIPNRERNTFF